MARPETRQEAKPSTLKYSEKTKFVSEQPQLQPRPPSSPAHSEQISGGKPERTFKRCFKNKPSDKAGAISAEMRKGTEDRSDISNMSTASPNGDQPSQEKCATSVAVRPPKTNEDPVSLSVRSTAANGKTSPPLPSSGHSPPSYRHDDNIVKRQRDSQDLGSLEAAAADRAQVRPRGC